MLKQAQIASALIDQSTSEIIQLIADYQRASKSTVTGLKHQTQSSDLLADYRIGKIPQRGVLTRPKGKFQFHGIGCRFEVNKRVVDVDFGPEGRFDGFDAWRLSQYAETAFEWQNFTFSEIQLGLNALEKSGLIYRPAWELVEHLYYFKGD